MEFVGLPDKAIEQIREWISSELRLNGLPEETNPLDSIVWAIFNGSACGICVPESETDQDSTSCPHDTIRNPEMPGTRLKGALQLHSLAWESRSIPISDEAKLSGEESASRYREETTTHDQRTAGLESDSRARLHLYWIAASLALVVLLIVGVFKLHGGQILHRSVFQSEFPLESHMGLRLERVGSDWRFSWNPDAPTISKATKAHLSITDGTLHKVLELDSSDLRGGAIIYTPSTNDVVLRLAVDDANLERTVSESLRIAGGQ